MNLPFNPVCNYCDGNLLLTGWWSGSEMPLDIGDIFLCPRHGSRPIFGIFLISLPVSALCYRKLIQAVWPFICLKLEEMYENINRNWGFRETGPWTVFAPAAAILAKNSWVTSSGSRKPLPPPPPPPPLPQQCWKILHFCELKDQKITDFQHCK